MRLNSLFVLGFAATVLGTALQDHADAFRKRMGYDRKAERAAPTVRPRMEQRESQFLTEKTKPFWVNGTNLPNVTFDVGESYAGLLPISSHPDETRELYFWYFPSPNPDASKEVILWLNGGPGCSSLHGLVEEFGPFTWQAGQAAPVPNPYSWTNISNVVWVEQPVGVGFTQGVPNITNEVELAEQFAGFWRQFIDTFDLHGRNMYVAGESYAGMFVSYIANQFITEGESDLDHFNLKGVAINDGLIGARQIQQDAAISPLADYWQKLFGLNDTFIEHMHAAHEACGYADYMEKYLTFPPPQEPFELPEQLALANNTLSCDLYDDVQDALLQVNPCFDVWHFTETCPRGALVLGKVFEDDYTPPGLQIYFNRSDVQAAVNAPVGTNWMQCAAINVFGGPSNNQSQTDTSISPGNDGVLQRIIEYTNNTFIGSGDLDFILSTNSTLLAIQNITWNGLRGLQQPPSLPLYAPYHPEYQRGALAGAGILGTWRSERGLTFYHSFLSGHELPGYSPGVAYRLIEIMLGRVANFSVIDDFSTQEGYFGNNLALGSQLEGQFPTFLS